MRILLCNLTKMVNEHGGLAKATCSFANEMTNRGHEVSLLYSDELSGNFFYHIDNAVGVYNARKNLSDGSMIKFPLHLKALREALRIVGKRPARTINSLFDEKYLCSNVAFYLNLIKPDIIISFQPASSKLLLCDLKTEIPVISMSHGDPEDYFHIYPKKEIPTLKKSAINQVLMPSFENHIKQHVPEAKTITIGNAITQFDFDNDLTAEKNQYKIIFVGALNKHRKRPHLLLQAFKQLADKHKNWIVELYGASNGKAYIKELSMFIKHNGLENRIFLKGEIRDVASALKCADIFAFPSAAEGFGMALAEGMSAGLPSVGYKSCPGVNELIKDRETGYLCDDGVDAFAEALDKLMSNRELRAKMGIAAKEEMKQYAPEKIWDKWENLIYETVKNTGRDV